MMPLHYMRYVPLTDECFMLCADDCVVHPEGPGPSDLGCALRRRIVPLQEERQTPWSNARAETSGTRKTWTRGLVAPCRGHLRQAKEGLRGCKECYLPLSLYLSLSLSLLYSRNHTHTHIFAHRCARAWARAHKRAHAHNARGHARTSQKTWNLNRHLHPPPVGSRMAHVALLRGSTLTHTGLARRGGPVSPLLCLAVRP